MMSFECMCYVMSSECKYFCSLPKLYEISKNVQFCFHNNIILVTLAQLMFWFHSTCQSTGYNNDFETYFYKGLEPSSPVCSQAYFSFLLRLTSPQSVLRDVNLLPFSAFLLISVMIFSLWPQLGACLFCILLNQVMAVCLCKTLSADLAQQSKRKWSSSQIEGQKRGRLRKWTAILLCTDQTYLRASSKGLRPIVLDLARTALSAFAPACLRDCSLITLSCLMYFFQSCVSMTCNFSLIPCDKTIPQFFSISSYVLLIWVCQQKQGTVHLSYNRQILDFSQFG